MTEYIPAQEFIYVGDKKSCKEVEYRTSSYLRELKQNGIFKGISGEIIYTLEGAEKSRIFFDYSSR